MTITREQGPPGVTVTVWPVTEGQQMSGFVVTEEAQRPARMDGACFYCNQPIGAEHEAGCVLLRKKVKIRMTVEYEVAEPASWDKEQIESRRNEGSWCCDNAMDELERLPGCLCGQAHFEYLGDTSDPYLCEK